MTLRIDPASLARDAKPAVDWLYALVMGVVEGLTEFLPISSTGHLIVTNRAFGRHSQTFEIAIQLGAITAILFLYWGRLWAATRTVWRPRHQGQTNLLWLIVLAALPPAVLGLLLEDQIDAWLFNNYTVATTWVLGGILLIALESWHGRRATGLREMTMEAMTASHAVAIGLFQTLALIPGTSRSGATIAGALLLGFSRTAAAEFSFLVGLPILYGASLLKLYKDRAVIAADPVMAAEMGIAAVAAFISAWLVVGPFVRFLQRHTFVPFGIYRIIAGVILFGLIALGLMSGR